MSLFEQTLENLKIRRQRVIDGKYNCIPLPFPRFRTILPGIERGKYVLISANQKVGKSKFCDYLFIYNPLFFILEHPELKIKVLYFTLEMSATEKYNEFLCHLLYKLDGIYISPTDLKSTDRQYPVDESVLELLSSDRYKPYIEAYENMVTYIDDIKNPTGINKFCRDYALAHGHNTYKKGERYNEVTGEKYLADVVDTYVPDDPEEYRVIIIDNASNLTLESGMNKMQNIDKMSKYGIELRNKLNYIFVLIQHQAQAQEGLENIKMDRLYPTSDGLADCKTTIRDINLGIGLFSPFKFHKKTYENYDITKFKNYIRFMNIMDDRDYGAGTQVCPLFFDGVTSSFFELPRYDDKEGLEKVYKYIETLEEMRNVKKKKSISFFTFNKNYNNKFGKSNIKTYLCKLFNKIK